MSETKTSICRESLMINGRRIQMEYPITFTKTGKCVGIGGTKWTCPNCRVKSENVEILKCDKCHRTMCNFCDRGIEYFNWCDKCP